MRLYYYATIAIAFLGASIVQTSAITNHTSQVNNEADFDPYDFDLLKDLDRVSSVDLILLKGWPDLDYLGGLVTQTMLVVHSEKAQVDRVFASIEDWRPREFLQLFELYEPKEYEPCFCSSKYVISMVFYINVENDGFTDNLLSRRQKKVAITMFDESHDSVLMTDLKNGVRAFRFSVGHSETSSVPIFIGKILSDQQMNYEFLKR